MINFIQPMAEGKIKNSNEEKFNFITVSILVSKNTTLHGLIKLIEQDLLREIGKVEKVRAFLSETWNFIKRIKIMDSGTENGHS